MQRNGGKLSPKSPVEETKKLLELREVVFPFNKSAIQELTFDISNNVESYDFISFLNHNYSEQESVSLKDKIHEAVIFKGATENFLGNNISEYCGLSVYLPDKPDKYFDYYTTLEWSKKSEWYKIFN